MKILHVADLHLQHVWFDWVASRAPQFDLLVIAGDLLDMFSKVPFHTQTEHVQSWLLSLPRPTVVTSGNHDFWPERAGLDADAEGGWLRALRGHANIIGTPGDLVEFDGLRIAVNGWLERPDSGLGIDLLVTHAPPAGCAAAGSRDSGGDFGDPELWTAIEDHPPRLILAGHIHLPRAFAAHWPPIDPSSLILVPGCMETEATPAYWSIETETQTAAHSSGAKARYEC